jgi:glycosyltransferase involved in cell wall biosynthesis
MNRSELLIDRCLRSIMGQTYPNLQIVVVGDHCTDDTEYQIAQLRDERISFINLSERGPYPAPGRDRWCVAGTYAANEAIRLSEGAFVTHLDDDDIFVPDRLEALVQAAQEHEADFLWHPFWSETAEGHWVSIGDGRLALGQITTGAVFYHRSLGRIGWDPSAYRVGEPGDWNRFRKIKALRPRTHFVARPLTYHYRERAQVAFTPQTGERFVA